MDWLLGNPDWLAAVANVGTFLVWVVYANFFYRDFRRERRPLILIDQMSGPGSDSTCTLANLSRRVVYVECVLAVVEGDRGRCTALVTDRSGLSSIDQNERRIVSAKRQGPVAAGQLISIGSIRELAATALAGGSQRAADGTDGATSPAADGDSSSAASRRDLDRVRAVEIRVVATMGTEDHPIGAAKRFEVDLSEGSARSKPSTLGTKQLYSRRERSTVRRWIEGRENG